MPLPAPPNPWRPRRPPRPRHPGNINVNVPGYTPDWHQILESDPNYMQFRGRQAGISAAQKAARNSKIVRDLIAFGSLPDLTGVDLGDFGIDEATRAQILANTNPNTSTTARLQREHESGVQALQDMLAARGMLRSGSLGVGLGQEQERYTGAQTSARQRLLDLLAGYQGEFADAETQRQQDLSDYAEKVKDDLEGSGLYEPRPGSSTTARRDPHTGLYVDADGNYYDRDGNPVRDPNRAPGFGAYQGAQRFGPAPIPNRQRPDRRHRGRPYQPGYRP